MTIWVDRGLRDDLKIAAVKKRVTIEELVDALLREHLKSKKNQIDDQI
ncbi:MAG: hypothetical protein RRB22_12180 [Gammaproteobacteria bacterium]|nr:hypothetical protein [Gammaproteobacteria bacterium]